MGSKGKPVLKPWIIKMPKIKECMQREHDAPVKITPGPTGGRHPVLEWDASLLNSRPHAGGAHLVILRVAEVSANGVHALISNSCSGRWVP